MDLTPKQQASEAIRQANNILILTGQHPSVDQVAAVTALAAILRKYGKKVSAVLSDNVPQQIQFLDPRLDRSLSGLRDFILKVDVRKAELDKLRYEVEGDKLNIHITPFRGSFTPGDVTFDYGDFQYDIAIILGVPTRARIDKVYAQNEKLFATLPVINIDFHRSNEQYGAVNLIESNASSLCEILVALAESLQSGIIDEDIATALLTGLMASTDRFTATHTTSKSLTVAAQMMAAGARQQAVVKGLYKGNTERPERSERPVREERVRPETQPQVAAPVVEAPATVAPAPIVKPEVDMDEPILDPQHIELSMQDEHEETQVSDAPAMADFSAAAEILNQMARDHRADAATDEV